jgi:predicted naringenin-chalcone synthase
MIATAYINCIGRAVPPHDVHRKFVEIAHRYLTGERERRLFCRMAERCQIEHRYSCLAPSRSPGEIDEEGFYRFGCFPGTAERMARYEREALPLAARAVADLGLDVERAGITHLIVASCTGFTAPGLDLRLAAHLGLAPSIERTTVGFMGCSAAIPSLKLARHIIRSGPDARVLVVALELCTLHFQEADDLERILSFLLFSDGCAAALVTAEPRGIEIARFSAAVLPDTAEHLTWRIGSLGFDMHLSGQVPAAIMRHLPPALPLLLGGANAGKIALWAVHPGGRTILDAVERGLEIPSGSLSHSRRVLREYGNVSSVSILFVLREMIEDATAGQGCAIAFGPGLAVEGMIFVLP